MILADTSVWVDHLRRPDGRLSTALEQGVIATHPFVIGELACGNLRNRRVLLELWAKLPSVPTASDAEALHFIDIHALAGVGLGYIDVHLLASTALASHTRLWTADRTLAGAAARLGVAHDPT